MFDTIRVDYPLPLPLEVVDLLPDIYSCEFQTKDLENLLEEYILTEDGILLEIRKQREWEDDDDAFLKGYFKEISRETIPLNIHSTVNFYMYETIENSDETAVDVHIDFLGKFTDGKLVDLELFNYEIIDSTERVKNTKEFFNKLKISRKKWYNKYFFNALPYSYFRKFITKSLYNLHNFTGKLHTFAIRHL